MEWYKGRLIAYSLGNFAGYKVFSLGGTALDERHPARDPSRRRAVRDGRLVPTTLAGKGVPALDPSEAAHGVVRTLSREDFGARAVKVSPEGLLTR